MNKYSPDFDYNSFEIIPYTELHNIFIAHIGYFKVISHTFKGRTLGSALDATRHIKSEILCPEVQIASGLAYRVEVFSL